MLFLWCLFIDADRGGRYMFLILALAKSGSLRSLRPYSSFATGKFQLIFEG